MTDSQDAPQVEMIPVDRITVLNPRVRNKKIFREIISNIAELGLKKPITVTRREDNDGPRYDLVCGQGRLEAYQALGQLEIPALVVSVDTEGLSRHEPGGKPCSPPASGDRPTA